MTSGRNRYALCALVFTLLVATPTISAQPQTAEAPLIKAGEYWTWKWSDERPRGTSTGKYTRTVVRLDKFEGQDVYVLSRGDGMFDLWNHELSPLATIDGTGAVKFRQVRSGDTIFPLSVGKIFTQQADNPEGKYRGETKFTVKGIEEIQTSVGTFTAFAVPFQGTGTSYDGSVYTVTGIQYYARAAKQWVKRSFLVQGMNWRRQYSEELVSYQVVP